jgi:signal transduction histidine kinase
VVYGILEATAAPGESGANATSLWISTNNGLSRFDPGAGTFHNYDVRDGLQGNLFTARARYRSRSGELFFGGVNGLNAFHPEQIVDNPAVPPIVLTSFTQLSRDGQDVSLGAAAAGARHIVLRWPDNAFEFEFAALNYIQPGKNQHAYMLEGFDAGWNHVGTWRYGKYTNVPAGTYTLRMIGSNNDGVWNSEGAAVTITVVPPFWRAWWFVGSCLILLVGAALGAYRLRVRSMEARSRELERQVAERTIELSQEIDQRIRVEEALRQSEREKAVVSERNRLARDLHDSVAQSMYGVVLLADVASQLLASGQTGEVEGHLGELKDTAQESLEEMRLLIHELRPPILEEEGLAAALQTRLELVESRAGLKTEFRAEGLLSLPLDVEEALYRIAQEALNNSLRHAQASRVRVTLRQEPRAGETPGRMTLEVADDGIGFDPGQAGRGGGLGLRGMAERAAEIGARVEIDSNARTGTALRVVWMADG